MAEATNSEGLQHDRPKVRWRSFFARNSSGNNAFTNDTDGDEARPTKWSMGVLNDKTTHEVPGSVLLLTGQRNEPLGLRNAPGRTSSSSLPSPYPPSVSRKSAHAIENTKKTKDGAIILEPQPDDSHNDPLNWPAWRRDSALLSLGFYCMIGGGMTPILAAGFTNVAQTYNVTVPQVALTTGLYMMGLGIGSVIASPTAILYGKRPVYLASNVLFVATSIWCATSPNYVSLTIARVVQGMSVSPVECLPSATIAEIFFLHERAYRIGIYTLLLLGGKNLIPLVSAAIIQTLDWRWVFWIVAITVGFCWMLLFLFVPETFWDRTPRPKAVRRASHDKAHRSGFGTGSLSRPLSPSRYESQDVISLNTAVREPGSITPAIEKSAVKKPYPQRPTRSLHVGFVSEDIENEVNGIFKPESPENITENPSSEPVTPPAKRPAGLARHKFESFIKPTGLGPPTPRLHTFNSPSYEQSERNRTSYPWLEAVGLEDRAIKEEPPPREDSLRSDESPQQPYTTYLKEVPRRSFVQQLKPWNGRLHQDKWLRVAFRPFVLFAYPAVLWSAVVYSCSVGWLIVLSESVADIYRSESTYGFSALSTGLVYISPFIGGVLGTAVAGKVSDIIVRYMSKRNGGLYEPEFRLVMAVPIAISTVIGLMGYGWSAEVRDSYIIPTIFFGVISFGCSLGSTTAITFCVDSYRAYAGEALVTLNFSKNIFHGLVFSLFFNRWLEADGSKSVFVALGGIQLALMLFTIPMYIYGKRARMWTVRMNFMEKF